MSERRIHDLTLEELAQLARSASDHVGTGDLVTLDPMDALTLVQMARRGAVARPRGVVGAQVAFDDLRQALTEIELGPSPESLIMRRLASEMLRESTRIIASMLETIDKVISGPPLPPLRSEQ